MAMSISTTSGLSSTVNSTASRPSAALPTPSPPQTPPATALVSRLGQPGHVEPHAVVLHLQGDIPVPEVQAQQHVGGLGVPGDVGDGLLADGEPGGPYRS